MPRFPTRPSGAGRAIRWMELVAAAQWTYERVREFWDALDDRDRADLKRLLEKSKGRPANLTVAEQRRVRNIAVKAFTSRH